MKKVIKKILKYAPVVLGVLTFGVWMIYRRTPYLQNEYSHPIKRISATSASKSQMTESWSGYDLILDELQELELEAELSGKMCIEIQYDPNNSTSSKYKGTFASMTAGGNPSIFPGSSKKKDKNPTVTATHSKPNLKSEATRQLPPPQGVFSGRNVVGWNKPGLYQGERSKRDLVLQKESLDVYYHTQKNHGHKFENILSLLNKHKWESYNTYYLPKKMCRYITKVLDSQVATTASEKESKAFLTEFFQQQGSNTPGIIVTTRGDDKKTISFIRLDFQKINDDQYSPTYDPLSFEINHRIDVEQFIAKNNKQKLTAPTFAKKYIIDKCAKKEKIYGEPKDFKFRNSLMSIIVTDILDISSDRFKRGATYNNTATLYQDQLRWTEHSGWRKVRKAGKPQWGLDKHKYQPTKFERTVTELCYNFISNDKNK